MFTIPRHFLLAALVSLSFLMTSQSNSQPQLAVQSARLGVNIHPLQDAYNPTTNLEKIQLAQNIGASIVRIDIHWAWIEPFGPGTAIWNQSQVQRLEAFLAAAAARNLTVLALVTETPCWTSTDPDRNCNPAAIKYDWQYPPADPRDLANFMTELVRRYGDIIKYWELWSEPNAPFAWWSVPNPESYVALLRAAYPAIKNVDPNATVIAGDLAPWDGSPAYPVNTLQYLNAMYEAGARDYFDVLSFHPYTDGNEPSWYNPAFPMHSLTKSVPAVRQVMADHGDFKPMWLTEIGWTTVSVCDPDYCWTPTLPTTEAEQAAYLTEAVRMAQSWEYVEAFIWYELIDRGPLTSEEVEDHFGLFRQDHLAKPAADAFRNVAVPIKVYVPMLFRR